MLPKTKADVLQGPEKRNLLYLGKEEEARLGLKTYAEQLQNLASARKEKSDAGKEGAVADAKNAVGTNWKAVKAAVGTHRQRPHKKVGASTVSAAKQQLLATSVAEDSQSLQDGLAYVGEDGWKSGTFVKVTTDNAELNSVVTTAALRSAGLLGEMDAFSMKMRRNEISDSLKSFLDLKHWEAIGQVKTDLCIQLSSESIERGQVEYSERLTLLRNVKVDVIESDVPAVVVGVEEIAQLMARRDEDFDQEGEWVDDEQEVRTRLQEQLDAAKLTGMSEACLLYTSPSPRDYAASRMPSSA